MIDFIQRWSMQRSSWALLFISVFGLQMTALYFQYGLDLRPCIMCIYQRAALFGVLIAALIPLVANQRLTRTIGYAGWGISSVWGFIIAREHVEIINAANPFVPCEIVPNFPGWFAIHEWFPRIFAANGDCLENSWQFAGMGMAEWMMVIFGFYTLLLAVVLAAKLAATQSSK